MVDVKCFGDIFKTNIFFVMCTCVDNCFFKIIVRLIVRNELCILKDKAENDENNAVKLNYRIVVLLYCFCRSMRVSSASNCIR